LKRDFRLAFAACCVVLLASACSLFQVAKPQSPSEALAYAYGTVATVRQGAASALQAGTISVATAQMVLKDTDEARSALDAGETALMTAPIGASGVQPNISNYLATATQLLTAAQKLLPQPASAGASPSK
jgi:hypothetical protein